MLTEEQTVRSQMRFNDHMRMFLKGEVPKGAETEAKIIFSMLEEAILVSTDDDITAFMAMEHE